MSATVPAPATNRWTVRPLGGALGAVVTGVDLRTPLDGEARSVLVGLLAEHLVVFFPGQDLDDDHQLDLALALGEPYVHPIGRAAGRTTAGVERIVDDPDHPPYQDRWHTDVSWDPEPPSYGTLRAVDVPSRGGDTVWASTVALWEGLSPPLRDLLEGLTAHHDLGSQRAFRSKAGDDVVDRAMALVPGAEHPVVRIHPVSGRRYLYVNPEFTRAIHGLAPDESDALLGLLARRAQDPNLAVRWRWTVGDLAVWDERTTLHFAVADYLPERREMARVAVR